MKKEEFKEFVRRNPKLVEYVNKGEITWQKFYEMYDLYGEDDNIWNKYLTKEDAKEITKIGIAGLTLSEVVNFLKNIDLESLQEGIGNVQRVLGVVQDFSNKKEETKSTYRPRPLYKHFDD